MIRGPTRTPWRKSNPVRVLRGPPRRSRSWVRQTIGSQSPSPWRSQLCHAFTEPGGYTRSQEDTKKIQFEYRRNRADTTGHERTRRTWRLSTGGNARNRRDTEGHIVVPVRDREAPGSNPGPRPSFEFRIVNSCSTPTAAGSQPGHNFPAVTQNRASDC